MKKNEKNDIFSETVGLGLMKLALDNPCINILQTFSLDRGPLSIWVTAVKNRF